MEIKVPEQIQIIYDLFIQSLKENNVAYANPS